MKDVRNHLVYHLRHFHTDGEMEDLGEELKTNNANKKNKTEEVTATQETPEITSLREQMGKAIDVLKCFDDAISKMFDGIRQRYKF